MNEDGSSSNAEDRPASEPQWRVDVEASRARLRDGVPREDAGGGELIYTDEQGRPRRLPADSNELSSQEIRAVAKASSYALGAVEPSYVQIVAIERLNELRASGAFSEEDYLREKRRILDYG
jgi:hypothetical protein